MVRSYEDYQKAGKLANEVYVHDGITTPAGWVHALYALLVFWICGMYFLATFEPQWDNLLVALGLTILFNLGIRKFSSNWQWRPNDTVQFWTLSGAVWVVAIAKVCIWKFKN